MIHPFMPTPTVISIPVISDTVVYEFDLATLEASGFKTGSLAARVHSGVGPDVPIPNPFVEVKLKAYRVWPFDSGVVRFQDNDPSALITTEKIDSDTKDGTLVSSGEAAPLSAPALRIVAEITANGGTTTAGTFTISAAILLFD